MYPKYKCLNCGRIWRSGEIMVICPVCRSKPIKIKEGVDIREVEDQIYQKKRHLRYLDNLKKREIKKKEKAMDREKTGPKKKNLKGGF